MKYSLKYTGGIAAGGILSLLVYTASIKTNVESASSATNTTETEYLISKNSDVEESLLPPSLSEESTTIPDDLSGQTAWVHAHLQASPPVPDGDLSPELAEKLIVEAEQLIAELEALDAGQAQPEVEPLQPPALKQLAEQAQALIQATGDQQ